MKGLKAEEVTKIMSKIRLPGVCSTEVKQGRGPKIVKGKKKVKEDPEATESDSDFEDIKVSKKIGQRQYLEEYMTMGEIAGRIPPSLIVNINFEKYAVDNDMQLIGYEGEKNPAR